MGVNDDGGGKLVLMMPPITNWVLMMPLVSTTPVQCAVVNKDNSKQGHVLNDKLEKKYRMQEGGGGGAQRPIPI